jgi:oligopeptide/dipeptide ABC transporter ATP-binding protein
MDELLKIDNIDVQYMVKGGMLSAVSNVSLTVGKKQIYALVGESGCGKSTIAFTIMQLLQADNSLVNGSIYFKGNDLLKMPEREIEKVRGKQIGMIFQNPIDSLNPVYKSGKQIEEALLLDNLTRKEAYERVLELYKDMKIPDGEKRVNSFPHELSGGMRQRVMIAMMLARNPELLIADEPTTALDVTIEAQILDILKGLRDNHGTSVLVITHNFGIVAEIADRVGVMYAGEMVEQGDVFQIFKEPTHPYTIALMQSLPHFSKHERRIESIPGSVPRIIGEFKGCRFANRCQYASEQCRTVAPPIRDLGNGHSVKCHREVW